ncbi:MAG: helix-turn-helix domain-containing protein, partial [Anaerococcus vaginalis]|nr:helix-turn-helix domain-containing protein [Anaerococcus vaginalis]
MKKLSIEKLSKTVSDKRKEKNLTQKKLEEITGINRTMISKLESQNYIPSIEQLESLSDTLEFEITDLFQDDKNKVSKKISDKKYNIAVAGTGYVGLSIATLLSQHNHVTAVDIIKEKVDLINERKSPIQDEYIEKYLKEKDLDLTA